MSEITVVVLGDPGSEMLSRIAAGLGDGVRLKQAVTAEGLAPELSEARVLFNWLGGRAEGEKIFAGAPHLEWIHSRFAGVDRFLFPALIESHVPVTNGSGVFSQSIGEFVILGAIYFAKDVPRLARMRPVRSWEMFLSAEIRHQTIGIVGHGDIGRAAASRAKALGMRVLALRRDIAPRSGDEHVDTVYPTAALHEMLPECDYVVVTAPLTPSTHHMVSRREFALMKPGSVIMNVGRGPVIDEAAMIEALQSGHLKGAALDVFEVEPLPDESPLWTMENVLLSPHITDHTIASPLDSIALFVEQFNAWRNGHPLKNIVDKRAGY